MKTVWILQPVPREDRRQMETQDDDVMLWNVCDPAVRIFLNHALYSTASLTTRLRSPSSLFNLYSKRNTNNRETRTVIFPLGRFPKCKP